MGSARIGLGFTALGGVSRRQRPRLPAAQGAHESSERGTRNAA
jgi:hypothetical protein